MQLAFMSLCCTHCAVHKSAASSRMPDHARHALQYCIFQKVHRSWSALREYGSLRPGVMTPRRAFQPLTTTRYDAIVIGTALPQALLAAALARSGSTVLHLDPLSFYGSANASLTTAQLSSAISHSHNHPNASCDSHQNCSDPTLEARPLLPRSLRETIFPLGARLLADGPVQASIDLVPRPLMAAGGMVDLLIRSDVGHYIDFRPLDALFVQFASGLRRVPASRSDVFQSRSISMPEKRLLMRFVKRCQESADAIAPEGSFADFMNEMALTPTLRTFLTQSISFCAADVSAREGVHAVYRYQQSLMRFGTKTPFLYPNYGSGELAQAFCRLCAVNGGTYVLRRGAAALVKSREDDDSDEYPVGAITTENEVIRARHVFLPKNILRPPTHNAPAVWRVAAVLDGSIMKDDQPDRVLVTVPGGVCGNNVDVRIRHLDSSVMVCESGKYVLYAETVGTGTEGDVIAAVRKYVRMNDDDDNVENVGGGPVHHEEDGEGPEAETLDCQSEEKPLVLWGISYARPIGSPGDSDVDGVVSMLSVEEGIDADQFIEEAERCFRTARPDSEFFPETRREETASALEEDIPNGHLPEAESVETVGD